jgi:hypothetical protein
MESDAGAERATISRRTLLQGSLAAAALAATSGLLGGCRDGGGVRPEVAGAANRAVRGGRLRATISGASSTDETLDPHWGAPGPTAPAPRTSSTSWPPTTLI